MDAYTIVPVAPVRASASHKAEIVTQLLFGETAEIVEQQGEFYKVKCTYDKYEGWVQDRQVVEGGEINSQTIIATSSLVVECNKTVLHLSPGSILPADKTNWQIGPYNFVLPKASLPVVAGPLSASSDTILKIAQQYMGASYLWGGKSIFGLDCSGFTQQVFKIAGIYLDRDAWQQALQGAAVGSLQEARPGDLAFFANEKGRINHVGIISSASSIMHASANARHDELDAKGIRNRELNIYTHMLTVIRRYV